MTRVKTIAAAALGNGLVAAFLGANEPTWFRRLNFSSSNCRSRSRNAPGRSGERRVDGPGRLFQLPRRSGTDAFRGGPMNFLQAVATCFRKYAVFSGRAARSEYWYFVLFYTLGHIAASILDAVILRTPNSQVFSSLFDLILFLPFLGVEIRRLHDVDRSGWWVFISLTIVGLIYPLLVWKCRKGTVGPNRYGDDPFGFDWVVSQFE